MYYLLISIILYSTPILGSNLYTVYAHGIADTPKQLKRFCDAIITSNDHTISVTFADTQKETGYGINRLISELTHYHKKTINRSKMYMGCSQDILPLHSSIKTIPNNTPIILLGCSRGAATIINELGKNNPEQIVAVILDASPAHMHTTIHPLLAKLGIHQSYDITIFSALFPKYDKNALTPLQSIQHIKNKNLPILLIHAQNDATVPYTHALQLYKTFLEHEFKHVYLATIPQGRHAFLLQDSQAKNLYLQAVHSFYKKYNLPFNEQYAQDDMTLFQPNIENIDHIIKTFEDNLQKEYEQKRLYKNLIIFNIAVAFLILYKLYRS